MVVSGCLVIRKTGKVHGADWHGKKMCIRDRDKTYIKKLQERNPECKGAFCGYGVAVKDFRNLIIEFDRNNTYIQSEGINQDFGVYDCSDALLKEHHQEISAFIFLI